MRLSLRYVAVVCGNQIRRVLVDRGTAFWLLALPIALIGILGLSLQSLMSPQFTPHEPFQVALAGSSSELQRVILERLGQVEGLLQVTTVASDEVAEGMVLSRAVDAAVLVTGDDANRVTLVSRPGAVVTEILGSMLRGVVYRHAADEAGSVTMIRTEVQGAFASGNDVPDWLRADAFTYYAAGIATMFLMFATHTIGVLSGRDRTSDTFARLRAVGVKPVVYMLGGSLASIAVGISFLLVMALVSALLFGVAWGDPLMWMTVSVVGAIASAGLSFLVMALLPQPEHGSDAGSAIFNVLAFLGGSMSPLYLLPEWFRVAFSWLPNRALLEGYLKVAAGAYWSAVAGELLSMILVSVVLFAVGSVIWTLRIRREA